MEDRGTSCCAMLVEKATVNSGSRSTLPLCGECATDAAESDRPVLIGFEPARDRSDGCFRRRQAAAL